LGLKDYIYSFFKFGNQSVSTFETKIDFNSVSKFGDYKNI